MVRIQLFSFITYVSLLTYNTRCFSSLGSSINSKRARKLVRSILRKPTALSIDPTPNRVQTLPRLNLRRFKVARSNARVLLDIQNQLYRTNKVLAGKRLLKLESSKYTKACPLSIPNAFYLNPFCVFKGELVPQSKFRQRSFFRALYHRVKTKRLVLLQSVSKVRRRSSVRSSDVPYIRRQLIDFTKRIDAFGAESDRELTHKLINGRTAYTPSLIAGWPSPFFVGYLEAKHLKEELDADGTLLSFIHQYHKSEDAYRSSLQMHLENPNLIQHFATAWSHSWSFLVTSYLTYSHLPRLDLYLRLKMSQKRDAEHFLRFRFKYNRLFVVFENGKDKQTQFFVTPGLFIKYFQSKKSLKKNKAMKFLMMRFLRKILLSLKVPSVGIITRGVPLHISALITSLFRPLSHPFLNPLTSEVINETVQGRATHSNISITSILFLAAKPKYFQKTRKRGRIKRKIRRKIVRSANLVD